MKISALISTLALFAASTGAVTVTFSPIYDSGASSLNTTVCSDGPHGLGPRFPTFSSLPSFPNIGAAQAVGGFGSPGCGTCWQLMYEGWTVNVLAIDHAAAGFKISQEALNTLTNGQAVMYGRIEARATQIDASICGL